MGRFKTFLGRLGACCRLWEAVLGAQEVSRNIAWALSKRAMEKTQVLLITHRKASLGEDFGLSQRRKVKMPL